MIYNTNKYTSRMPYIGVTIAGKNMSVIPPKYINSFSVDRYTQDENGAASFSLNLVAPVSTFDTKTADSLTFLLNYLLSSSVLNISEDETEANLSLDLVYGWQNGETFSITDATVTACDVVISDAGNIATYVVSGVVDKVMFNGNLKNFYGSTRYLESKSVSESNFTNLLKFPVDNHGVVQNKLSYIIENIAKFLYGNDFNVVVDHNDVSIPEKYRSDIAAEFSSSEIDKSAITLFNYLNKLISSCYVIDADLDANNSPTYTSMATYGDTKLPAIYINGSWYVMGEQQVIYGEKYTPYSYDPNGSEEENYPFNDLNLITAVSDISYSKDGSVLAIHLKADNSNKTRVDKHTLDEKRTHGEVSSERKYIVKQIPYFDVLEHLDFSNGSPLTCFDKYFSRTQTNGKYTLRITANAPTDAKAVFIISNNKGFNQGAGDVISFDVKVNSLPAISAMSAIANGKNSTTTVENQSGLSIISTTDLGGLSASDANEVEILQKQYLSKLLSSISEITEANLQVFATQKSCNLDLIDLIRVVPTINNGNTYFVGDYNIYKVTDTVDSEGFKTSFNLRLHESDLNKSLEEAIAKQLNSGGVGGDEKADEVANEPDDTLNTDNSNSELAEISPESSWWDKYLNSKFNRWLNDNAADLVVGIFD